MGIYFIMGLWVQLTYHSYSILIHDLLQVSLMSYALGRSHLSILDHPYLPALCLYMGGCQYLLWVYFEWGVIIHLLLFLMSCITIIIYQLWCEGVSGTAWTVITYLIIFTLFAPYSSSITWSTRDHISVVVCLSSYPYLTPYYPN